MGRNVQPDQQHLDLGMKRERRNEKMKTSFQRHWGKESDNLDKNEKDKKSHLCRSRRLDLDHDLDLDHNLYPVSASIRGGVRVRFRKKRKRARSLTPLQLETRFWGQSYLDLV